jgi:hypothetical protein
MPLACAAEVAPIGVTEPDQLPSLALTVWVNVPRLEAFSLRGTEITFSPTSWLLLLLFLLLPVRQF